MGLTTLFTDEPYIFCKASKKLDVENSLDKRNLNVSSKRSSLEFWSWIVDSFSIWKSKFSCTCWKKIIKNYNLNNKSSLLIAVNTKLALKKKRVITTEADRIINQQKLCHIFCHNAVTQCLLPSSGQRAVLQTHVKSCFSMFDFKFD